VHLFLLHISNTSHRAN